MARPFASALPVVCSIMGAAAVGVLLGFARRTPSGKPIVVVDRAEPFADDKNNCDTNPRAEMLATSGRAKPVASFTIKLQQAYYRHGIVNPGAQASMCLGEHGERITVQFDDGTLPVVSKINRTANPGGYVRLVGDNHRIKDWFNDHFVWGDVVNADVLDRNTIMFHGKRPGG